MREASSFCRRRQNDDYRTVLCSFTKNASPTGLIFMSLRTRFITSGLMSFASAGIILRYSVRKFTYSAFDRTSCRSLTTSPIAVSSDGATLAQYSLSSWAHMLRKSFIWSYASLSRLWVMRIGLAWQFAYSVETFLQHRCEQIRAGSSRT